MRRTVTWLLPLFMACGDPGASLGVAGTDTGIWDFDDGATSIDEAAPRFDGGVSQIDGGSQSPDRPKSVLLDAGPLPNPESLDNSQPENGPRTSSSLLALRALPGRIDLMSVKADCRGQPLGFFVENVGHEPIEIETIGFPAGAPLFFESEREPPFTLYPADPFYVTVWSKPPVVGSFESRLETDGTNAQGRGWLDVPIGYQAEALPERTDTLTIPPIRSDNVVIVVSSAPDMGKTQFRLRREIRNIAGFWAAQYPHHHVAVTTMDLAVKGGHFVRDSSGSEPWLTTADPAFLERLTERVMVGFAGSPVTQGLEAARRLLALPEAQSRLRIYRDLEIIFIQANDDQSNYGIAEYETAFARLPSQVLRLSTVSGGPSGCMNSLWALPPAPRLVELSAAVHANLCTSWSRQLHHVGTWSGSPTYYLSREPYPSSIRLFVDGVIYPQVSAAGDRNWEHLGFGRIYFTPLAPAAFDPRTLTATYLDASCQ